MHVIGLTGKMATGKDTFFEQAKASGYHTMRLSFADAVREEVEHYIADGMFLPAIRTKPYSDEARALLQWWGTDFRRAQDPEYWLKVIRNALNVIKARDEAMGTSTLVFITDVRFPNEADIVKEFGGTIVRLEVPLSVRCDRLKMKPDQLETRDAHISERALENYPVDIFIDATTLPYRYYADGRQKMQAILSTVDKDETQNPNTLLEGT